MRNVAGLQAQLAQNQGVNALAQQEAMVEQEAMNTSRAISTGLTDQLRQAQLMNLEQVVGADEQLYNLQQQERAEKSNLLMELSALLQDGTLTPDSIANFMTLAGYDMSDFTEEQQKALSNVAPDYLGNLSVSQDFWSKAENSLPILLPILGTAIGALGGPVGMAIGSTAGASLGVAQSAADKTNKYTFGKETYNVSADEMVNIVSEKFAGKPGMDSIKVDKRGNDIVFKIGNKIYKTYNEAYAALTGQGK